jgi:hypothetical protein
MRFEAVRPLDDVKAEVAAKVKKDYLSLVGGVSPSGGRIYVDCVVGDTTYRMDAGEQAASRMDGGFRTAEELGEIMTPVRDYYNTDHYLPIEEARQIRNQQALDARSYWLRKCELNGYIAAAATVKELREIDLSYPCKTE